MDKLLEFIAQNAGEGVILRKPSSVYEHGRSSSLVKVKVSHLFYLFIFFILPLLLYTFSL